MMNKKTRVIASIVVGLFLFGGAVFAYSSNQIDQKEQEKIATEKTAADEATAEKQDEVITEKESTSNEGASIKKDTETSKQGSYVTRADYDKDPGKYADSKKVYFFHASWCSVCQGIDKEINADTSKIPAGVTVIKTDFDTSTDLRQKYGVTTQYTFVQVDGNSNETAQWSATSLQKVIEGI